MINKDYEFYRSKKKILIVLSKSYQHDEGGNNTRDRDKKKPSVQTIMLYCDTAQGTNDKSMTKSLEGHWRNTPSTKLRRRQLEFQPIGAAQIGERGRRNNRTDYSAPLNIFHVRKCPAEPNKTTTMTLICRTSWRILFSASLWSTELFTRMNCPPYISKSWALLKKSVILWVWYYALWREQEYSRDELEIPPPGRGRFPRCLRRRRWLYVANRIALMGRIRELLLLDFIHVKKEAVKYQRRRRGAHCIVF